jgi:hypothetical protein
MSGTITAPHIEIHHVVALRVEANGRVTRLRVIGAAERHERRINVDVVLGHRDLAWVDVDPEAKHPHPHPSSIRNERGL